MTTKKPAERRRFILDWVDQNGPSNVLDADFVSAYIEETGAPFEAMPYGAHRCPMLGRDLAALYRAGALTRDAVGVPQGEWGMPSWVYDYQRP